ncbi:ATP-binding cassette domain-containing protein [Pajaroellobacter abortibovis]|uniref:ABC transporter domain-containing protein n=1 Tax=Pajaroellobacter abortibovis TaxID=1882918 RepID=A0A1L6MVM5_9BACT|nr:ATP-binding cassette domain-containing protein [Pajaroellobacter abortibovis]APR99538.1 hypothetical protein BCY86_01715 [Pajaroellobacter abortibovis]
MSVEQKRSKWKKEKHPLWRLLSWRLCFLWIAVLILRIGEWGGIGWIVSAGLRGQNKEIGWWIIFVAIWMGAASFLKLFLCSALEAVLLQEAFRAVLSEDGRTLDGLQNEDLTHVIWEGVGKGVRIVGEETLRFAVNALVLPWFALLFWKREGTLSLVWMGGGLAIGVILLMLLRRRFSLGFEQQEEAAYWCMANGVVATVRGRLELIAAGREEEHLRLTGKAIEKWTDIGRLTAIVSTVTSHLPFLCMLAVVGGGFVMMGLSSTGIETLWTRQGMEMFALWMMTLPPLVGVVHSFLALVRLLGQCRPFFALLQRIPVKRTPIAVPSQSLPSLPTTIELRHVCFSYGEVSLEEQQFLLAGLNMVWKPGTLVLVKGPNGSGKSTWIRLLLGLIQPDQGSIRVQGRDLAALDQKAWRRSIAFLPQRPFFPELGTVREAIQWLIPHAEPVDMERVLERVGLRPFLIDTMKHDPLGVRVATLSMGQRQRLALARLLLQKRSIFLLDEPETNLDELGVMQLAQLMKEIVTNGGMIGAVVFSPYLLRMHAQILQLGCNGIHEQSPLEGQERFSVCF